MRLESEVEAEFWVLSTGPGAALLAEVAASPAMGPAEVARWRRRADAEKVAAAIRLAEARLRAASKFERADRMWLDPRGVEQATAEPLARHKARRFAGEVVVDLCSGIGGDAIALAAESRILAVDVDRGMCRRGAWNARVYGVEDRILWICSRAETLAVAPGPLLHVDPDRRGGRDRPSRRLADYTPSFAALRSIRRRFDGGAIKVGPASDFNLHVDPAAEEVELLSWRGECKEATIWFGALATCRRRATVLPEGASWTDRDGPMTRQPPLDSVGPWIFDPDPALIRSGLVDAFAAAHGLRRCAEGVDYLTGPEGSDSPFLSAFEVREVGPPDLKAIRRWVTGLGLGALEIKVRGLDVTPESLRSKLRLEGSESATLLLFGRGSRGRAVLARRANPSNAKGGGG